MSAPSLTSRNASERAQALAALRTESDRVLGRELATLEAQKTALRQKHADDLGDATAAVAETLDACDRGIAGEFLPQLDAHCAAFASSPRDSAVKIGDTLRAAEQASQERTGSQFWVEHLLLAFARTMGSTALAQAATENVLRNDRIHTIAGRIVKAAIVGTPDALLEQELRAIEAGIATAITGVAPASDARVAALRGAGSYHGVQRARLAIEAADRKAEEAASLAKAEAESAVNRAAKERRERDEAASRGFRRGSQH